MNSKFNFLAFFLAFIFGTILVNLFGWLMGLILHNPLVPVLSMFTGYIITGFLVGIISKEITILEPGLGAILVSVLSYFILTNIDIPGFFEMWDTDWLLVSINAIVLTFIGAWIGEMFQHGAIKKEKSTMPNFDWGWIIAGSIFGLIISFLVIIILLFILGPNPEQFYIPFFLGLIITGLIIGWMSPGVTIKEAGIAGFLSITIIFNIVRMTLYLDNEMPFWHIVGGLVIGFILTYIGGFLGEKIQSSRQKYKEG